MAEVSVHGSGCENEDVVGHASTARETYGARGGIDARHFAQLHVDALITAKNSPDRLGDVGRRQCCSGDLIQQRLKQVIIVPVNDGDRDIGTAEPACDFDPAEAASYDDDVSTVGCSCAGHLSQDDEGRLSALRASVRISYSPNAPRPSLRSVTRCG